jgi:hypothetical protein
MHPAAARELLEAHYYSSDAFCNMINRQWHHQGNTNNADGSSSSSSSHTSNGDPSAPYEPPFGKYTTVALTRAKHWREIQSLVQEYADAMNSIHVCCALSQLAKLHKKQQQEQQRPRSQVRDQQQQQAEQLSKLVSQLMERVTEFLPGLSPTELAGAAWAAAELGVDGGVVIGLCGAALSRSALVRQLRQQEQVALGVYGCGMLLTSLVRIGKQQQQQKWELAVQQVLEEAFLAMQEQQLLNQARIHGDGVRSSSKRHEVRPRALAQLGWGAAAVQVQLPKGWLECFCSMVGQVVSPKNCTTGSSSEGGDTRDSRGGVSARDVQMLLYSLAVLAEREQGSAAAAVDALVLSLVDVMVQPGVLQGLDDVGVSNTLWALGTLGHRPSESWFSRVLDQQQKSNMVRASAQSVSNTLWGLATLCVLPKRAYMLQLMHQAKRLLPVMTPQALANTLWALAVLEFTPSEAWLTTFWSASSVSSMHFTTQGLVNLLWAVSRLKLSPNRPWLKSLLQQLQQQLPELQPQAVANIAWSLAHMQQQQAQLPQEQQPLSEVLALYHAALDRATEVLQQRDIGSNGDQQQQQQSNQQYKALELANLMYSMALVHRQQEQQHKEERQQIEQLQPRLGHQRYTLPAMSEWVGSSSGSSRYSSGSSGGGASSSSSSSSNSSSGVYARAPRTLQGLEKLEARPAKLCRCALAALQPLFASAGPQELANCLWSVVQLGLVPPKDWMGAWFHASLESMAQARPRDLAQYVWSLAKLGRYPPFKPWMAAFQVASYRKIESFDAQVWALLRIVGSYQDCYHENC